MKQKSIDKKIKSIIEKLSDSKHFSRENIISRFEKELRDVMNSLNSDLEFEKSKNNDIKLANTKATNNLINLMKTHTEVGDRWTKDYVTLTLKCAELNQEFQSYKNRAIILIIWDRFKNAINFKKH